MTVVDVRRVALGPPRTTEHLIDDRVEFRVRQLVYVAFSQDETLMGFAFPKEERAARRAYAGSSVRTWWNHREGAVVENASAEGLLRAERALQAAQLAGDVDALDRLLDERLVAIGPDGARYTKEDDLAGHRSGSSVVSELVEEHVEVLAAGTTGITFFVGTVSGTFEGQPMSSRLRYTRTWVHDDRRGWRILAVHIAVLPGSA